MTENNMTKSDRSPDALSAGAIGKLTGTERMKRVLVLDSADSTNRVLHDLAGDGAPDGQVVIANEQKRGRGRMGRDFFSPKDKGLYFSYLMRPRSVPGDTVSLTARAAVSTMRAIEASCGLRPGIKWVNDLVLRGRKLCGILTEMSVDPKTALVESIIIGIGVNVNNSADDFPEELSDIATSLFIETGRPTDRAVLCANMIREMDRLSSDWQEAGEEYLSAYRAADVTCGRDVTVISGGTVRRAAALSVNDDFSLKVKISGGGVIDLDSGEVSLKLL